MSFDLVPAPPSDVRAALDRLLERELTREEAPSAWWLAGVRESVDDGDAQDETAVRPRSSRGATRA